MRQPKAGIARMLDALVIEEQFVRASGPGGQNVNKVATAVQLHVDVQGSSLPAEVKKRLTTLAGHRMTADGRLVIDSREHRTQARNRAAARERLAALLERAATAPKKRKPTAPRAAVREERIKAKKQRGAVKVLRGRATPADD